MSKEKRIILVEHRPDYKALYGLNLYVYLGIEVYIVPTVKEFAEITERFDPAVVFVVAESYSVDIGLEVFEFLQRKKIRVPFYILGKTNVLPEEVTVFDSKIELKEILQNMAKTINITSKIMADRIYPDYFPLPTELILPGWQSCRSVYRKQGTGYEEIFKEGDIIRGDVLDDLEKLGIQNIYVKSSERLRFVNSVTFQLSSILNDPSITTEEKVEAVAKGFQVVSEQARKIGIAQSTLDLANECIELMSSTINTIPDLKTLLGHMTGQQGGFIYQRCLLASFIGSHIIKKIPWGNKEQQEKLAFVAFFHDITLIKDEYAMIDSDQELSMSKLPASIKKKIKIHAASAANLLHRSKNTIPFGIATIIKQHHGDKSGTSLSTVSLGISPLAIVFVLAEKVADYILRCQMEDKKPDKDAIIKIIYRKYNKPAFNKILPILHSLKF